MAITRTTKAARRTFRPLLERLERRIVFTSDFGDAPLPYKTLLAEGGAEHVAVGPTLGAGRDVEADGVHSVNADGDDATEIDDEDGIGLAAIQVGELGAQATVRVAGGSARLDAWIDFNGDGSWGGPGEQIADRVGMLPGANTISFDVPSWAVDGTIYARFRLSTGGPLGPGGLAADGEVEDYAVAIQPPNAACGCFSTHTIATTANSARSVYATDVDADGDTDVLSASTYDDKIAWYENDGSQNFAAHTITTAANNAQSVFATDVDGDGDTDVLSASESDDKIAWYENDGNQNFTARTITTTANGANSVYASDVDGDGDMDVLSASRVDDKIAWYENNGSQNFTARTITTAANRAHSVYAGDVDGDGDTDVLSASFADNKIAWYENNGNQSFITHVITTAANGATNAYAADVDGDGDTDVLSSSFSEGKIAWYENDGNQNFTTHIIVTAVDNAFSVYAADMDGDGDLDVLSAFVHDIKVAWYENDGNQNFTTHTISTTADGARSVYAADVDGDGDLDVLSASFLNDEITWYENFSFRVINPNDSGPGSLRQAIDEANAHPGLDTITFAIGTGAQTIAPTSPLPTITDAVVIDGTTQPGYAGMPLVELTGGAAGANANGLTIAAGNNIVTGLVINSFAGNGIRMNSDVNRIEGNFIGTDVTGTLAMGNGINGVEISGGSNNRIGGAFAGASNIIAFNGSRGIMVDTGIGNSVRQNAIFANGSLGIALTNGGNNNQARPFVLSAVHNGSSTTSQLRLLSTPNTTFTLELFVSSSCDPSGSGEGESFLQAGNITTNAAGRGRTIFANLAAPVGSFVTATATSPSGDTSEFSLCAVVTNSLAPGGDGAWSGATPPVGATTFFLPARVIVGTPQPSETVMPGQRIDTATLSPDLAEAQPGIQPLWVVSRLKSRRTEFGTQADTFQALDKIFAV